MISVMTELCQQVLDGNGMPNEWQISVSAWDGQFRIPNLKDSNPKLSKSKMPIQTDNRIRFISCLQALSRCLVTDFLFCKSIDYMQ